ncbi:MAG: response regulator, partial [Cyclobacteriaceae bacterium]|nr:response regulator [Cyclobacteriaceae bacterium]
MKKLKKILLVDDDETTNYFNQFLIEKIDAAEEVLVALNGEEALQILSSKNDAGEYANPDLILLDVNMPIMNGFEFMKAYHKLDKKKKANVVICMLTTSFHEKDVNTSKEYEEISDYTKKPL